jgi:hemerythrin-like domain-containing protein
MEKKELLIEFLREEHRKIERVLCVLEQELSVFNRNGRPDYTEIRAVISYFQEYPDCCHHPKEEMVFEKLKARDPAAAATVGDLEAEHQGGAERLQRVADVVKSVLTGHEVPRKTFNDAMHDFIEHEREHMEMEERVLFRVAVSALRPEDWIAIAKKWQGKRRTCRWAGWCHLATRRAVRDQFPQWPKIESRQTVH